MLRIRLAAAAAVAALLLLWPSADAQVQATQPMARAATATLAIPRAEMPAMLREHQDIATALGILRKAAQEDGNADAAAFADQLAAHAAEEEQILYPGAPLVGAYLRTRR